MAILTDTSILEILCPSHEDRNSNNLLITPYERNNLTPVGYDLTVGGLYSSKIKGEVYDEAIIDFRFIKILPGDTVLIRTLEHISMPEDKSISGFILSKVSRVSEGLSHVATTIDADWSGRLLIAVTNHSKESIVLEKAKTKFCTMVLLENADPSTKSSDKPADRTDILVREWAKTNKKTKKKEIIWKSIYISIIPLSFLIGYFLFNNKSGLIASTMLGVAISQIFLSFRNWE